MDIALLIGRILFGGLFIIGGLMHLMKMTPMAEYAKSKNTPAPKVAVFITGIMILLGGLGVLLGTFITAAITLLVIFLVVVAFVMHDFWDVRDTDMKMIEMMQFMKNLALAGAALALLSIPQPWYASLIW